MIYSYDYIKLAHKDGSRKKKTIDTNNAEMAGVAGTAGMASGIIASKYGKSIDKKIAKKLSGHTAKGIGRAMKKGAITGATVGALAGSHFPAMLPISAAVGSSIGGVKGAISKIKSNNRRMKMINGVSKSGRAITAGAAAAGLSVAAYRKLKGDGMMEKKASDEKRKKRSKLGTGLVTGTALGAAAYAGHKAGNDAIATKNIAKDFYDSRSKQLKHERAAAQPAGLNIFKHIRRAKDRKSAEFYGQLAKRDGAKLRAGLKTVGKAALPAAIAVGAADYVRGKIQNKA